MSAFAASRSRPASSGRIGPAATALVVLLCAVWGLQQIVVKLAIVQGLPPATQAGLRSAGAAALLCVWVGVRGGRPGLRALVARDGSWPFGIALGTVFAVEFLLMFAGLARTSASRGVLFLYTAPFYVALGAHWLIPGERLRPRQVAGLACAFAGVGLALLDGLRGGGGTLAGDAMVVASAVLWGLLTVMVKASRTLQSITPAKVLLYQLAGSAPLLLAAGWALGEARVLHPSGAAWLALGYQAAIVAFASYLAWYWLISRYPAGRLSAFTFLTPLFGMAAAALLLGDPVSVALVGALVLVAAGLTLVNSGVNSGRSSPD